jgi:two-component system OmpR family response regulator/two-component system response regulator CpxR
LAELMRHAGSVVSREDLTRRVLHRELTPYDRSIDVHVSRVRNVLRQNLGEQELIITIRGIGYQFSN